MGSKQRIPGRRGDQYVTEYEVRTDMPGGAIIHAQLKDGVACISLNDKHRELWPVSLMRAGLDCPPWVRHYMPTARAVQAS